MSSRRVIRLSIVLLMAGPVGCATVGPDAPRYEVLSMQPATGSLTAERFRPLISKHWTYERPNRDSETEIVLYRRGSTQRFGAEWVTHQGNERSEYWRMDDQGNVVMTAVISHVDRAISLFQPPLIIAYRELSPGEKRQHEVARNRRARATLARGVAAAGQLRCVRAAVFPVTRNSNPRSECLPERYRRNDP